MSTSTLFNEISGIVRTCRTCAHTKPIEEFCLVKGRGWRKKDCRSCDTQRLTEWKKAQREKNPEAYRLRTAEKSRARRLRSQGISVEQYDRMLADQGGVCAICKQPERRRTRWGTDTTLLPVDHDHKTGVIRGLLCHACNKGVGLFKDDPNRLTAAAEYLRARS